MCNKDYYEYKANGITAKENMNVDIKEQFLDVTCNKNSIKFKIFNINKINGTDFQLECTGESEV